MAPQDTAAPAEEIVVAVEGPLTPDDDETYGPEPDDPRAAGGYHDPYEVDDFDPANEQHEMCCGEVPR